MIQSAMKCHNSIGAQENRGRQLTVKNTKNLARWPDILHIATHVNNIGGSKAIHSFKNNHFYWFTGKENK